MGVPTCTNANACPALFSVMPMTKRIEIGLYLAYCSNNGIIGVCHAPQIMPAFNQYGTANPAPPEGVWGIFDTAKGSQ